MDAGSAFLLAAIVAAFAVHARVMLVRRRDREAARLAADASAAASLLDGAHRIADITAGVTTFAGSWNGQRAQIRTIVDTLATRKLPALWLSVTITEPTGSDATLDLMMRPGSATTFSNFDRLPFTLPTPVGYPEGMVVRSDDDGAQLSAALRPHLKIFADPLAKELLITPNGVRLVYLLAEADRARYGVFRQAEFSGAGLDARVAAVLLGAAAAIAADLRRENLRTAA